MSTRPTTAALAVALTVAVASGATGCVTAARPAAAHHAGNQAGHATAAAASPTPSPAYAPTAPAGTPLGAGERVWAAFSHRGIPQHQWWAALEPLLSDSARATYVYDDPRNLPELTQTGRPRLAAKAPDEPRFTAEVVVPTSKGAFRLDLERHTLTAPWLLYAITFPPGIG